MTPSEVASRVKSWLRPVVQPRHFHAYTIGTAKSGTTSFAYMFRDSYRSGHEPDMSRTLEMILDVGHRKTRDASDLKCFVSRQDRELWLEMNSSQLNYFLLPALRACFPDARFVLTIRNCYDWLDSIVNHQLSRPLRQEFDETDARRWEQYRSMRFERNRSDLHPNAHVLLDRGLFSLEGYLSYWARHNERALRLVPNSRLLVVRTQDIHDSISEITSFLDVPRSSLNLERAHANKARARHNILDDLDRDYLESTVDRYCQSLMDRFFPGIRGYADARA